VPDRAPDLSIVIPTYNERDRLANVVDVTCGVFASAGVQGELVIVDDNSPDGTGAIAESLKARYPVQVVHRPGKLGLGTAVIDGFAVATAPVMGVMDGDLSHPPESVADVLKLTMKTSSTLSELIRLINAAFSRSRRVAKPGTPGFSPMLADVSMISIRSVIEVPPSLTLAVLLVATGISSMMPTDPLSAMVCADGELSVTWTMPFRLSARVPSTLSAAATVWWSRLS
jgi:glycosyltransferase involved in cell wall biosynthesis